MTKENIVQMVMLNLEKKGDDARAVAEQAVELAIASIGKIDYVPWNKIQKNITLTSGQSIYVIGTDILDDVNEFRGILELWRTDEQGLAVSIYSTDKFNGYKRGSTDTGAPYMATIYIGDDNEKRLEIYYTPDDAYVLWGKISVSLEFDMIDDDYKDLVAYEAMKIANPAGSGFYEKGVMESDKIKDAIKSVSFIKWQGSNFIPTYLFGEDSVSGIPDRKNYWGLR